jgi:guanine deaminase
MQDPFMSRAIELAVANVRAGRGGPFAALVVKDGAIIAEGANLVTSVNDPAAHAEIVAIRAACRALGAFQLPGCDIYTTCEPCPMCLGAIYWARPARVFCGASSRDAAEAGFDDSFIYEQARLPWEARRIPIFPLMREEALRPFREWAAKPDKTPY